MKIHLSDNKMILIQKKVKYFTISLKIVLLLITLNGCMNDNFNNKINLNKIGKIIDLKLSDIVDGLRWVALETNPHCLIGIDCRYYMNDKYILTFDQNKILQFSGDGKFIRELSKQGKGPNEFIAVRTFTVNDEKEILYFQDHGKYNAIYAIDLKNGKYLPKILLPNTIVLNTMSLINDSIFICASSNNPENGFSIFSMDINGNVKFGFRHQKKQTKGPTLIPKRNEIIQNNNLYLFHEGNALFQISEMEMEEIFFVDVPTVNINRSSKGKICTTFAGNCDYILYKVNQFNVLKTQKGTSITSGESELYLTLIKNELKSYKVRLLENNLLKNSEDKDITNKLNQFNNGYVLIPYNRFELKENLNNNITMHPPDNNETNIFKDNPILLTGIIKHNVKINNINQKK